MFDEIGVDIPEDLANVDMDDLISAGLDGGDAVELLQIIMKNGTDGWQSSPKPQMRQKVVSSPPTAPPKQQA